MYLRNHRQKIIELLDDNQTLNAEYDNVSAEIALDPKNYHCWKYL